MPAVAVSTREVVETSPYVLRSPEVGSRRMQGRGSLVGDSLRREVHDFQGVVVAVAGRLSRGPPKPLAGGGLLLILAAIIGDGRTAVLHGLTDGVALTASRGDPVADSFAGLDAYHWSDRLCPLSRLEEII